MAKNATWILCIENITFIFLIAIIGLEFVFIINFL